MFRINIMTRGRYGNIVLQYNRLMQIASLMDERAFCTHWEEGSAIFDLPPLSTEDVVRKQEKLLTWRECVEPCLDNIKTMYNTYDLVLDDPAYMLHNVFFQITHQDPRKFLPITNNYKRNLPPEIKNVGIHFRGTDILGADGNHGREIHRSEYYINSIDFIESEFPNTKYYICTDDLNFESYNTTIRYLENKKCVFEKGSVNDYLTDFATLAACDILIASSSTFVVCAGFLGKSNKRIVHSKEWIDKNISHFPWHYKEDPKDIRQMQLTFDDFWIRLYNGGNKFYNIWRLI